MAIRKVARLGHPVLRAKARPVDPAKLADPAVQRLIDDLVETMIEYQGVGLAAPQVHEGLRIFVAAVEGEEGRLPLITAINPEVVPIGTAVVEDWEGCLSIPDLRGRVPRAREVELRALDRAGRPFVLRARDLPARVIQHEADHLDGILFLDRMRSFESLTFLDEYTRFWTAEAAASSPSVRRRS